MEKTTNPLPLLLQLWLYWIFVQIKQNHTLGMHRCYFLCPSVLLFAHNVHNWQSFFRSVWFFWIFYYTFLCCLLTLWLFWYAWPLYSSFALVNVIVTSFSVLFFFPFLFPSVPVEFSLSPFLSIPFVFFSIFLHFSILLLCFVPA